MAGTYPSLATTRATYYSEDPPEYMGDRTIYLDGGCDTRSYSDTPVRRWTIIYGPPGGLTAAQAADFSTLAAANKYNPKEGSLLGFDFVPRGEASLGNVRFDEGGFVLRRGPRTHIYVVEVRLIKRP